MSASNLISFYNSAKDVAPSREITVGEFARIIHDEDYAEAVAKVRDASSGDEKTAAKLKLPAVQLSGRVTAGNRAQAIQQGRFEHSSWLQLDIDGPGLGMKTPEQARAILGADRHVLTAFISPSGEGAKAVFKIRPCVTDEEHKSAFRAVEKHISAAYGMTIDPATKDSSRLCYFSADSECTWNGSVTEFVPPVEKTPEPKKSKTSNSSKTFPVCPEHGIHSWLMEAAWHCRLRDRMDEPETITKLESFNGSLRRMFQPNEVIDAVRTVFLSPLPDAADSKIPDNVFPVPANSISLTDSAKAIFPAMANTHQIYMRGGNLHEIGTTDGIDYLDNLTPEAFCNRIENYGKRVARREVKESQVIWRNCIFPTHSAKLIMKSRVATEHLPPIRQLSNCAIITPGGEILSRGYHGHAGGTFISRGSKPPEVPFEAAKTALIGLLCDFDFPTPADKSRAMASLISPALKMGGWIQDDFPLDVAEATASQSGKTYRQKIVCRIYGETPKSIIISKGGVGSVDEAIATALVRGRPFITLGNVRGKIDSTIMEEAIRGAGMLDCRIPHRETQQVDCRPFLWQLSTNGAELTRDLANRSIVTRICKQSDEYQFRSFPEGDMEAHIVENQPFYIGCVFSILKAWRLQGCPTTHESRHDFKRWCRALDGIINMIGMAPLLDGHREQQARTANPNLQWLRDILIHARPDDQGVEINVGGLLSIAEDSGIDFPATGNPNSKDDPAIRAGRILGKIFREAGADEITVDGFIFARTVRPDYSERGGGRTDKFYTFSKS